MSNANLGNPWTTDEDATLRKTYKRGGIRSARRALRHRSTASIYHRAARLGLATRRWVWSAADDKKLRTLWDAATPLATIATKLDRTRLAVYWRARAIGLRCGAPEGWEYLHEAAERTGFDTSQIQWLMARAGKKIHRALTRPTAGRGKRDDNGRRHPHRFHIVWPSDVDEAVEDFLARETVEKAARKQGMATETLRRRLRALGIKPPAFKKRWLVTEDEVARALALQLIREPLPGRRGSKCTFIEPQKAKAA